MDAIKSSARRAGILYLLLAIIGPINAFYIPGRFIIAGDPAATAARITANPLIYRLGILSELFVDIIFLVLVLVLYQLLKDADRKQARLMVVLVSVGVAAGMVTLMQQMAPLVILNGGAYWSAFTESQLATLAFGFLRWRSASANVVQLFWGLWLFPFGLLVMRSGLFPKVLGVLLFVAGFAYSVNSVTSLTLPEYAGAVSQFMLPLAAGELGILFWLLIKGAKAPQPA